MKKITIVGGGIVGAFEAYRAWQDAQAEGETLRVTIYEKHPELLSTAMGIAPSLTPDEILAVVPRGRELIEALTRLFNEPRGIRVDDVVGVNDSPAAQEFIAAVERSGADDEGYKLRTSALLELGKKSMDLWRTFYEEADSELKRILEDSNFNPCHEPLDPSVKALRKGYRIDLIAGKADAIVTAEGMSSTYKGLGYHSSQVLSPDEVVFIDPFLCDFCEAHSEFDGSGKRVWKNDAAGVWRPGGCIDVKTFLPKFYDYLKHKMGSYSGADGAQKPCFHLKFNQKVDGLIYDQADTVAGLLFADHTKRNKRPYTASNYVLAPGEAVGTLRRFGLKEPPYAGFAGASLKLIIPIPAAEHERFADLRQYMEVHKVGVVLAWQARIIGDTLSIAVGGTKAFYADIPPHKDEAFACDRNLLQLNMINDVLPKAISLALGRDTKGQTLTREDLITLEARGIATRWVGTRAVAYDGVPNLGRVRKADGTLLTNARVTTALGSGGVSFVLGAVAASRAALTVTSDPKTPALLNYTDPSR